jgi:hypothetical protein
VGVAKLFNQLGTLRSFAAGWAAEDKSNFWVSEDLLHIGQLLLLLVLYVIVLLVHLACCLFV